jgi:hypothetical protein
MELRSFGAMRLNFVEATRTFPRTVSRWVWWSAVCYLIVVTSVIWGLLAARHWALADLATPKSTAEWEAWRADVRAQQDRASPVSRAVPKSAEPPGLVLMRDYFGTSLVGGIIFSSVLYWICAGLLHGMLTSESDGDALDDVSQK